MIFRRPAAPVFAAAIALTLALAAEPTAAADDDATWRFLQDHCADCHADGAAEGGFELAELRESDASRLGDVERWVRVWDRVHDGEMPPAEMDPPSGRDRSGFLDATGEAIRVAQRTEAELYGRVQERRLTSVQLERTLHDLLGIDRPLARMLPEDRRTDGFTTVADGQSLSHFDLQNHLALVDIALDEALARTLSSEKVWTRELTARDLARKNPRQRNRDPEYWKDAAVVWSHNLVFYGRISETRARADGWYRFTFDISTLKEPEYGVWCTVRTGHARSTAPIMREVATFQALPEKKTITVEAWLDKDQMFEVRPHDDRLKKARTGGGQVGAGECQPQDVPGIAMHKATLEKFQKGPDRDRLRDLLFADFTFRWNKTERRTELVSDDPAGTVRKAVEAFLPRAFRRPVDDKVSERYVQPALDALASGARPEEAIFEAYRAILCSPRFLYHVEPPGQLDAHSVANRLSYLLTGSMPDEELRALADSGRLLDEPVLRAQVRRLIDDPDAIETFVADFAHEWLDLSEIDFTEPDRRMYPGFDLIVQNSMVEETRSYLRRLIEQNLSAGLIADSDFLHLNERLASFYGFDEKLDLPPAGPNGEIVSANAELRSVPIAGDDPFGGLMTQGAIMKVTANGTTTSPILRGVWIGERLLGMHVPDPPANVPAVEPDIRGATTIREQLAKHRSDPSCASCHRKIDPAGFALESFDPSGRFREKYRVRQGRKIKPGPKVDPSDELPEALGVGKRSFDDVVGMQRILADRPEPMARSFVSHLLTYGTGARPGFAERDEIGRIVRRTKRDRYGLRSLLTEAILSDVFLTK